MRGEGEPVSLLVWGTCAEVFAKEAACTCLARICQAWRPLGHVGDACATHARTQVGAGANFWIHKACCRSWITMG